MVNLGWDLNADYRVEVFAGFDRCHVQTIGQNEIVCRSGYAVKVVFSRVILIITYNKFVFDWMLS